MMSQAIPALELHQVSYKSILTNISLTIEAGKCTAIVGASGAGKSTLLRLLNRLIDQTSGKILMHGKDIQTMPIDTLRSSVMLVPQEPFLLGMTVQEAIAYPLKLKGYSIDKIQSRLKEWTERLQLDHKLMSRTEVQLSVGQKQWVSIARALVTEPEILVLDEPTSALDSGRANFLLDLLRDLTPKLTVIMVNHQLDLVSKWCSNLIQLHRGQLVLAQSSQSVDWQALELMLKSSVDREYENKDESEDWD